LETTLAIENIGFGGAGVGRLPDGRVCFVHGTLPGERVAVKLVLEKKNYTEGELVRLLEASPRRVRPPCPVFGECGGCAYQHMDYDLQREVKTGQVADLMRRVGGFAEIEVRPTLASPLQWGYRNRVSVHVDDGEVGFHHRKSRRVVRVANCPIACDEVNEQLAELASKPPSGRGRVTLRTRSDRRGFSQVNDGAAEVLLSTVRDMLFGLTGHLVDAYCGSGFFAKSLRGSFAKTTGIEWSAGAISAARRDAADGETYLQGAVEHHLADVLADFDDLTLLVDPPSEGLASDVVAAILVSPPQDLVYVSCDPSTLARDLKKLSACYDVRFLQPVDMFPQTAEIEVAAACRRR